MDKYTETFETWNNIAGIYQDKFMKMDLYDETYDYICTLINKKGAKLLEIGCGPGNITQYLLSKRPDFDIFGIDIAPNMIELARKNNPAANFAVMDTRDLHSLNTKYDGVVVGFCLPYLSPEECTNLINQSADLLNENGLIYLSFVEGNPAQSDFKSGSGGRVFFQYHNLNEVIKQLTDAGFGKGKIFKVNFKTSETTADIHTIVVAQKMTKL